MPTGDVDALRAVFVVRVRRLLGMDVVVFGSNVGRRLRRAYSDTANRSDYEALLGTSLALGLRGNGGTPDPAAFRRALKAVPDLPRVVVRVGRPPELDYGADILYGQWREAGLGPVLVRPGESHAAELTRLIAAYPQAEALPAALALGDRVGPRRTLLRALARVNEEEQLAAFDRELHASARAIPIAWVTDARLVSRRLRDWHEDVLGNVDYARVRLRR